MVMTRLDEIVDVSHHQSQAIDFVKLKDAGIIAVMHKATQGRHFHDPKYKTRRDAAEAAGLLWGAYHFSENAEDGGTGLEQAKYFLDFVGDAEGVFLSLDYESYHHKNTPEIHLHMSLEEAENFIDAVSQRIGRLPFFYSGSTIRDVLGKKKSSKLGACKLWAAGYVPESKLKIQKSWSNWTLWQYTDGKKNHHPKPIPGFGSWDRSVFDGTEDELRSVWAS
jgi:lysozyme